MSLGNKLKDFFTSGGCVAESKIITLDTIQDAINLIKDIKHNNISEGAPKVLMLIEQLVHWVNVLQKDMEIIKSDKLRSILHDIAEIKIQLVTMVKDIDLVKSMKNNDRYKVESDCISKIKDTVKKIKKQKENNDGNK